MNNVCFVTEKSVARRIKNYLFPELYQLSNSLMYFIQYVCNNIYWTLL